MAQKDKLFIDAIKNFINKNFKENEKEGILTNYENNKQSLK